MSGLEEAIVMAFGVLLVIAGVVLFAYFRTKGVAEARNKVKIGPVEVDLSAPSLVIFIAGVGLFVFPFLVSQAPGGFSFTEELSDDIPVAGPSTYDSFVTVKDDTRTIEVEIPRAWSDVSSEVWEFSGEIVGPVITATADFNRFFNTFSEPGMIFGASSLLAATEDEDSVLNLFDLSSECEFAGRSEYEAPAHAGKYDLWVNCAGTDAWSMVVASVPADRSFITFVAIHLVSEADLDALDNILGTFLVLEGFEETWGF